MSFQTTNQSSEYLRPLPKSLQRPNAQHLIAETPRRWHEYIFVHLTNPIKPQIPKKNSWTRGLCILLQILGGLAFIIACIALWPAIASAAESRKANKLAQWTSTKDFLEFCESRGFDTSPCLSAQNLTLVAPPGFPISKRHRSPPSGLSKSTGALIPDLYSLTGILLLTLCAVAVFGLAETFRVRYRLRPFLRSLQRVALRPFCRGLDQFALPYYHSNMFRDLPPFTAVGRKGTQRTDCHSEHAEEAISSNWSSRIPRKRTTGKRRQVGFSRYKTANSHLQKGLDDTSDDEFYTSGSARGTDARRCRTRLRRRGKRVGVGNDDMES